MELGHITITKTLKEHCEEHGIQVNVFLDQYVAHQWGELDQEDIDANNAELNEEAGHILAKYNLPSGEDIYIETSWNAEFRHTSIHFPSER